MKCNGLGFAEIQFAGADAPDPEQMKVSKKYPGGRERVDRPG